METLSNIRINKFERMKIDIINAIIKALTGLSGGVIAMWLLSADSEEKEGVPIMSKKQALFLMIFGLSGAFFLAPAINEYFGFEGGLASCISFLSAIFCNSIILLMHKILKSLLKNAEEIGKRIIKRIFG